MDVLNYFLRENEFYDSVFFVHISIRTDGPKHIWSRDIYDIVCSLWTK